MIERIGRYNRTAEIIECAHRPLHLQNVLTGEQLSLDRLRDTFIGSLCGIAAPESFEEGLRKLGARIELSKRYTDHHRYSAADLASLRNAEAELIVTTEKDAVRCEFDVAVLPMTVSIEPAADFESWLMGRLR